MDIGAFELQGVISGDFIAWLASYGLATDGSADYADPDADNLNNWEEWRAGTVPINSSSVLKILSLTNDLSGTTLTWQSVGGKNYYLQRSTNLAASPAFAAVKSNIVGQAGATSYTDHDATNLGPYFYRVGVQ